MKKMGLLALAGFLGLLNASAALAYVQRVPFPAANGCFGGPRCQPSVRLAIPAYSRLEGIEFFASSYQVNPWDRAYVNILVDGRLVAANVDVTGVNQLRRVALFGTVGSIVEIAPTSYREYQIAGIAVDLEQLAYPQPPMPPVPPTPPAPPFPPRPWPHPGPHPGPHLRTEIVSCDSWRDSFARCGTSLRQIRDIRLLDQRSGSRCREGRSYGFDSRSVWVNDGCRATFQVTGF